MSATGVRQVWVTAPRTVELRRAELGTPPAGHLLVRTERVGICGSDLHTYTRRHPWLDYPISPGHEVAGTVAAVGDGVEAIAAGDRVYVQPALACGDCRACLRGLPNLCERLLGVGAHVPGGMADAFLVRVDGVRRLPEGVSFAEGAMIEPFAAAMRAVRRAGDLRNRLAAVIGGGTIGLASGILAARLGAEAVAVSEPHEHKRALAIGRGLLAVDPAERPLDELLSSALGARPDVLLDCVGSATTIRDALSATARGGTVVVVGVGHGDVSLPIEAIQDDERTIRGTSMYDEDDVRAAHDVVCAGVDAAALVTATMPLAAAAEAFELAASGREIKVHLVPEAGL